LWATQNKTGRETRVHDQVQRKEADQQTFRTQGVRQKIEAQYEGYNSGVKEKQADAYPEHQIALKVQNFFGIKYLDEKQADGDNE
jgi:hypothetical protein